MTTASIRQALDHGTALLDRAPALALGQADAILAEVPADPRAQMLRGAALWRLNRDQEAWAVLAPLTRTQPRAAAVQAEFGRLLARSDPHAAIAALRRAAGLDPAQPVWRELADLLKLTGDDAGADAAYARHLRAATTDPALMMAADALASADLPRAEALLRAHLKAHPGDVAALRMLAEAGVRLGRHADAEALLRHCLDLAPSFTAARHLLGLVLHRQDRPGEALAELDRAHREAPGPDVANLLAATLAATGRAGRAAALYQDLATRFRTPGLYLSLGHASRTAGQAAQALAAYRAALPAGQAWWSIANMKTAALDADDIAAMRVALAAAPDDDDRLHLHYALGRAQQDAGLAEAAWTDFAAGAKLRRAVVPHDTAALSRQVDAAMALPVLPGGADSEAPIFIVGLPRSGSTLIEQMLASHSQVEGTLELPEMANTVRAAGDLLAMTPDGRAAIGRDYLRRAAAYRQTDRPYFIDKMPNNWVHAGLIRLMLPRARIIHARRDAMACCVSCFTQHFARGQNYSYDLAELATAFRDCDRFMAQLSAQGAVHVVQYEDMVAAPEATLRALLAFCGLAFEPGCLRFFDNDRPVRTASSEQVRRPIYRSSLDQWRMYEPWLGGLRDALRPAAPP